MYLHEYFPIWASRSLNRKLRDLRDREKLKFNRCTRLECVDLFLPFVLSLRRPPCTFPSIRAPFMSRRGPLQELPLDMFPGPHGALQPLKLTKATKRSHSPEPSQFSPTKRRILNDEGFFATPSARKTHIGEKTSPVASTSRSPPRRTGTSTITATPSMPSISAILFTPSACTPSISASASLLEVAREPLTMNISMEAETPTTNPYSIHYPGFVVYTGPSPAPFQKQREVQPHVLEQDEDEDKENLAVRRFKSKVSTFKSPVTPALFATPLTTPKARPGSSTNVHSAALVSCRTTPALTLSALSPPKSCMEAATLAERKAALKAEVDEVEMIGEDSGSEGFD
jgi:hypothetical protein